jgi:DNA-binding response OmpR family regulator
MNERPHLLIVDDDREIRGLLAQYLEKHEFRTTAVPDGKEMRRVLERSHVDLLVLDLMLPGEDGLSLCRELRARTQLPIIMLTARSEDVDRIVGLELGADDYLSKPFNPRELVARIRAILRRASNRPARDAGSDELAVGPIVLNSGMHQVRVSDQPVALTGAEFRVLELLMRSAGQVISRESMTEQALGRKLVPYDRSIDTHISNLRRKLNLETGKNPEIKNVRGSGYTLTTAPP